MMIMKKILFTALLALSIAPSFAQEKNSWGIKGGLNYNSNGDLISEAGGIKESPKSNTGYHFGFYKKIQVLGFFLRPELIYTETTSDYDGQELSLSKIDLPFNLGSGFIGPTYVFAGPSFQYIIDSEFNGVDAQSGLKDISLGANFGIGLKINKLALDLRYERGLSEKETRFVQQSVSDVNIDLRPSQLILSLFIEL
jgi:hypothetical protein